jgi:signal transduction histidine kinase
MSPDGMLSIPYEEDEKDEILSWPAERSVTGLVIKNKKSLLLRKEDVRQLLEGDVIDLIGTPSEIWLGVPLFQGEKVIGAIAMQSYNNPEAFDESTVGILEFISGQVSMAIQRKRMFDELLLAKEKAEEGDRLKTAFLNNLSHEIRTPLNAIVGFSQFLNEPGLDAERISHITSVICRSSDQLLSIISDIISISTIEAGILDVNPGRTNVNRILKDVYDQLRIKAAGKGLELHYRSSLLEEDAAVMADETKLVQIISNLVDNAIKFTHKGAVEFGCSLKDNMIRFFVNDTGIGIAEALHPIIFERFHQIDAGHSSNMGGLGLGLPIAKSFVERMGGKIWLESSPGHGTRFTFSIPYQPVKIPAAKKVLPDAIPHEKKGTILVAEDEENNFELTKTILTMVGLEVLHAWDGKQAVSMCEQHPEIDMVLMDIKMPVINGYEATRLIKEKRPGLPVIALTAYALIGDREKAMNAGCDDYMAKPVSLANFQEMIQKHLK